MSSEENWCARCEEAIRRSPRCAVAAAFLVGLVVRIVPVAALAKLAACVLLALVRPALLVLGIGKAIEIARDRRRPETPLM